MLLNEDGQPCAYHFGPEGTVFRFSADDADAQAIAFTKAVNDGIERGEEIEGEAALQVAEVIKEAAAGTVVWNGEDGLNDWRDDIQASLPRDSSGSGPYAEIGGTYSFYVEDISRDGTKALVCGWGSGQSEHYVVPITVNAEGEPCAAPKDKWVKVEEQYVATLKAGRKFSSKHLEAMKTAHEALGKLIAVGDAEREAPANEKGDEPTEKSALAYTVEKANSAMRYTLGPLYAPMREDAHKEWIEADELQKSVHDFVRDSAENGRRINLQHGDLGDIQCGEWVECLAWPYEHTIKVRNAAGEEHEVEMPAGTVYLGVVWDEEYWDVEKSRPKGIDGYSLGGRAMKVRGTSEALKSMGYKVQKTA